MPEDQPETLNLGGAGYRDNAQGFKLRVFATYDPTPIGGRPNYQISADVVVRDSTGEIARLVDSSPLRKWGRPPTGSTSVPLVDALVPWDRLGGTYTGSVDLAVTARITKDGVVVAGSETRANFVGVRVDGTDTPA